MKFNAYPPNFWANGIISSINKDLGGGFSLYINTPVASTEIAFVLKEPDTGLRKYIISNPPSLGIWTHHVYTFNYSLGMTPIFQLYVDGSFVPTTGQTCCGSPSSYTVRDVLAFGNYYADQYHTLNYFPSMVIDDVALFEYILSSSEVNMIYNM